MKALYTPLRWPNSWKNSSAVMLLKDTAIDFLLIDSSSEFEPVRSRAHQDGFRIGASAPEGVSIIEGEWPGVHMARGGGDQAGAGPTGVPWVDSNGWKIRLAGAFQPDAAIWVDAKPDPKARTGASSYLTAIADSAAHGGRWIISLDDRLAAGLAAENSQALATWKKITEAAGFFARHKEWAGYAPVAVLGVISDFSGANEFFSHELLNLLARAGQQYRILRKSAVTNASFEGLRAVIYADAEPPSPELRKHILAFVESGGLLITGPVWGTLAHSHRNEDLSRYAVCPAGKGRIAQALTTPDDPYMMANDSVVLVSHRYDLVRFWNGGATGYFYTMAPSGKSAVVHLLFYADFGPNSASVRIAGRFRSARAASVSVPQMQNVGVVPQRDAIEIHLPQVNQYVALELEG